MSDRDMTLRLCLMRARNTYNIRGAHVRFFPKLRKLALVE
jgi:hypothetical protein